MKKINEKILPVGDIRKWRESVRRQGIRLVVTNGCFDLLHIGHATYLEQARNHGDMLLVGINDDQSVRQLKGSGRPTNPELHRASVVAALQSVDFVCIFSGKRATKLLEEVQPDIWVKGGDYTLESLDESEKNAVFQAGGKIVIIPIIHDVSTTKILARSSK